MIYFKQLGVAHGNQGKESSWSLRTACGRGLENAVPGAGSRASSCLGHRVSHLCSTYRHPSPGEVLRLSLPNTPKQLRQLPAFYRCPYTNKNPAFRFPGQESEWLTPATGVRPSLNHVPWGAPLRVRGTSQRKGVVGADAPRSLSLVTIGGFLPFADSAGERRNNQPAQFGGDGRFFKREPVNSGQAEEGDMPSR